MGSVILIKKEHEAIERELVELETIMEEENINFPNLIHVFNKLHSIWDSHEEREEKLFNTFRTERLDFPVDEMLFAHRELKGHRTVIANSINSGSEFNIKTALGTNGRMMINKLREHIKKEEDYFGKI